jgi:hypothetical protein
MVTCVTAFLIGVQTALGAVVDDEVEVQGNYTTFRIAPGAGAGVEWFGSSVSNVNHAGGEGLLLEGFGVGNFYVPNRRLNENLEIVESAGSKPVLRYRYECDGPNIRGLRVTRTMEPQPDEASIRVTWKVENQGDEDQWVAPWVRNEIRPGGAFEVRDRVELATWEGIVNVERSGYHVASRNWVAATDPAAKETLYAVFHSDQTHSFLVNRDDDTPFGAFQTAFVPRLMKVGDAWETVYRVNVVRGLTHVNFATDELAAQVDYEAGELSLLLAAVKPMPGLQIEASILAANGQVWRLPKKQFDISPDTIIRCTYDWQAPGNGTYELLARITRDGEAIALGADTGSPHGGIDTQFVVGDVEPDDFEPWTDAPFALERGSRTLQRQMAVPGDTAVWFESSLEKIFPEDVPRHTGDYRAIANLSLAANESESFQVVVRPPSGADLTNVNLRAGDLVNAVAGTRISAQQISLHTVAYHPVRIPTHFEGPTGVWPDALPDLKPFTAQGGQCSPIWITVHAPAGTPPGNYEGYLELTATGRDPVELGLRVTVFDFELPRTPSLKTDFGFWIDGAESLCRRMGYTGGADQLLDAYLQNGLRHRVTLRELAQFPAESADYKASLATYEPKLREWMNAGASTIAVPPSLLNFPEQLKIANNFVEDANLRDRVFCPIANEPERPAWPRLFDTMQQWREIAPNIPLMLTTYGTQPFFHEAADIWAIHSPVMDTVNNRTILDRVAAGNAVWWYVNHTPPRPYANFFLDFAAIEHRIFFWQTWALGIQGVHYWNANYSEPGVNPWVDQLDITPTNGDGFLLYPGPNGPVSSIRLEVIRDGIEDYDYLVLFRERMKQLEEKGGHDALLAQAAKVYNLKELVPDLVTYTRDPNVLISKRDALAEMIVAMDKALQ